MKTPATKGVAVVTGASSGIGAVYADRLARRGYDLILVARRAERLIELAGRLAAETGRSVETLTADLNDPAGLARVETRLRTDPRITLLVNNAGVGATAPLLDADVDEMTKLIALNTVAPTRLTYAAAPSFVARGRGAIINIASIVAVAPEVLNGVYGASKAFVLALTLSLELELAAKGVQVQAVLPGATRTDFWSDAGRPVEELPSEIVMSAEDLVDAALLGFDRGEAVTIPSLADVAEWDLFEGARKAMQGHLSSAKPAPRYRQAAPDGEVCQAA
jgi:short-subunit dehydrogenase